MYFYLNNGLMSPLRTGDVFIEFSSCGNSHIALSVLKDRSMLTSMQLFHQAQSAGVV